jgi:hypothetical protein
VEHPAGEAMNKGATVQPNETSEHCRNQPKSFTEETMKRLIALSTALLVIALTAFGCASPGGPGWETLIDGDKGLQNFNQIGDANWRAEGGAIVATKGKGGYLVSKKSYSNFDLYVEFWANEDTQSGIFLRVSDPKKVGATSAYEVNIYDKRPGQEYRTGAIVDFAQVPVPTVYKTNGGWNTYRIYSNGSELTVELNGTVTVSTNNSKFKKGPIALQFGNRGKEPGGTIKWRKLQVRAL